MTPSPCRLAPRPGARRRAPSSRRRRVRSGARRRGSRPSRRRASALGRRRLAVDPTPEPPPAFDPIGSPSASSVVAGLDAPLAVVNAGDGSGRLFVAEQGGQIRIVRDGTLLAGRRSSTSAAEITSGGERGLLGLAFHPRLPDGPARLRRLHRHERRHPASRRSRSTRPNPDRVDPASEQRLLFVKQPLREPQRRRARVRAGRRTCTSRWATAAAAATRTATARRSTTLLGKILRIDVDGQPAATRLRASRPTTRSSTSAGAEPEIWLYGLRNPWRI